MIRAFSFLAAILFGGAFFAHASAANAAEPPPLEAYGELAKVEQPAISGSGDHIAAIVTTNDARVLVLLDDQMRLVRSFHVGDLKIRGLSWIGDEAVLLTNSETEELGSGFAADQYEAFRSMIIPVSPEDEPKMVFTNSRGIVDSVFGRYGIRLVDNRWEGFFSGLALEWGNGTGRRLPHTRPTLFSVDLAENKTRKLASPAPENHWHDWLIDENGQVAATFDMNRSSGEWTIEGPHNRVIAGGQHRDGDAGLVSLGKDGTTVIFFAENEEGEYTDWLEVPLDGSTEPAVVFADENIEKVYTDHRNGRMIGYWTQSEGGGPVFFDPAHQEIAEKLARAFSAFDFDLVGWTPDLRKMIVRTSGNGDSGTFYLVNMQQVKASAIGVERPQIKAVDVGPISIIEYVASDGLAMDGILTLPPERDPKGLPLVMLPHGGPNGHDTIQFDWWAQAFASRGYAVFQPNFRGSTHRGERFVKAGDGEFGRKMLSDIADGLATLAQLGIVDPKRTCIMGASYGGYAALAGVTLQQGLYRCSVAVAPVSDVSLMYRTDMRESGRSRVLQRSLLDLLGPKSDLKEISPRNFAHRADAPILLIHGRQDTVVPFRQSEIMADALEDADKPFELVDLEEEDHWLTRSKTRLKMLEAAMEFVLEHNPPD